MPILPPGTPHERSVCDPRCPSDTSCYFCEGELFYCNVCGGFEGSLTKECCGCRMTKEEQEAVYLLHTLEFFDGNWWVPKREDDA